MAVEKKEKVLERRGKLNKENLELIQRGARKVRAVSYHSNRRTLSRALTLDMPTETISPGRAVMA